MHNNRQKVWGALVVAAATVAAAKLARRAWPRFPVAGRVALITGSSRGFGLALAERFARAGARVVLTARDPEALERARTLLLERGAAREQDLLVWPCDLRENEQVVELVRHVEQQWGQIDILVNNAGVISVGPVESQPLEAFEDAIRSNYFSMVHASLAVLPGMLGRGEGAIVNIASIGGKVAVPHLLPYSGSKFAAVGFSQGLHAEVRARGVRVTTVTPGLLRTGSPRNAPVVGKREEEFRWFNLGDSVPGSSRDAYAAAGRVLRAVESAETELSITPQAAVAARLAQALPEVTALVCSLVNRALPAPDLSQKTPMPGRTADGKDLSSLTGLGRRAEQQWNEE
ncbi:SDR family oxidoreductase [Acidipila sp. EB88]|uniref:SDR family NAD(P)-dependent oxidoreductase n=1 Tax=Acidipila sp. EB88 TaxID=2305226 RepID=UPI00131584E3|nr:SDR family oxidoreductase [Acidipila sp. EB88]